MEDTTEMLSMSRPLPSTVIVGVPARKYIKDINFERWEEEYGEVSMGPHRRSLRLGAVKNELSSRSRSLVDELVFFIFFVARRSYEDNASSPLKVDTSRTR